MKSTAMRWGLGILCAIVLLRLPMWLDNQFYLNHIISILLLSVVVLGYWLIHRTGQVSFAQGGFMMIRSTSVPDHFLTSPISHSTPSYS